MSFVNTTSKQDSESAQVDYRLHQWRIRITSTNYFDVQIQDEVDKVDNVQANALIPDGSRVTKIIVDNGEIVEKIYSTSSGARLSVRFDD